MYTATVTPRRRGGFPRHFGRGCTVSAANVWGKIVWCAASFASLSPTRYKSFFPFPLPVIHFDICEGKESIQTLRPSFASLISFFARAYLMGMKDRYQSRKSPPTKFARARIAYWNGSCRLQIMSQDQLSISRKKNILKGGSIHIDITVSTVLQFYRIMEDIYGDTLLCNKNAIKNFFTITVILGFFLFLSRLFPSSEFQCPFHLIPATT